MSLFVENIVTDSQVSADIKELIPDASLRRRMSRVVKTAVATAVECVGGVDKLTEVDAIITATGLGCLADSEKFLSTMIESQEQMLNPTPFIQSTFNTVGGQLALLGQNHCYNMTFVNRTHSFEDALLDCFLKSDEENTSYILLGSFDEKTDSQSDIMERMGLWRTYPCGEGSMFAVLNTSRTEKSIAEVSLPIFPQTELTSDECLEKYASCADTSLVYNDYSDTGLFPTVPAFTFAKGVRMINEGAKEVIVYNSFWKSSPTIMILKCIS